MKEAERCLDSRLWHACAGSMVQMPLVNSKVFYFPQGHAEHALANVDFGSSLRVPAIILCRVAAVKFMADPENDEVYTKITLVPLANNKLDYDDDGVLGSNGSATHEKPVSFAKSLTQSDANNGGGFSVPRYCAETIFPPLDYSADPPVQTLIAKDVHGDTWKFRHIYRGTPRRHLLTTGWSNFVNQKKLVAGDSIVFLRAENGDLCIGIKRAKRAIVGAELPSGWNSAAANSVTKYGGYSVLLREDDKLMRSGNCGNLNSSGLGGRGRVRRESVKEALALAAKGQPFEIVYYPHASTPEFCIKASSVKAAMRIHWCSGMRFKMAFETEDSSRISWFMGTIASVRVADPFHWPNSPWRLLQVTWDEPDLLQNVKCVNPWLVELVSNMPILHQSPFLPPRKKLRFLEHHPDIPLDSQFPFPSFSGNHLVPSSPLCCLSDNISAGIQGARHAQFGILLPDIHLKNKLHLGLVPSSFQLLSPHNKLSSGIPDDTDSNDNVSCLLTMGNSVPKLEKKDNLKKPQFLLFGQPILTEQQISNNCSADVSQVSTRKWSSAGSPEKAEKSSFDLQALPENISSTGFSWHQRFCPTELDLDTCHCEVFMESEDLGQTIDLSVFGSYEELNRRLANMLGIEGPEMPCHVLYRDATGAVKQTGDEPFSDFMKTAKRLTILQDSGSKGVGRNQIAGLGNTETGLDSSIPTGPLGIFTLAQCVIER